VTTVDILAIVPHPDDAELLCGGTLIKAVKLGHRTAVLDLAAGEAATRGSVEIRAREAQSAAKVLGLSVRENLGWPDAGIENTPRSREELAKVIRRFKPQVVIAPASRGRHPDHRVTAELVREACFIAGLQKIAPDVPKHRPRKVIHATAYREDHERPTFIVDITDEFEQKLKAIRCFASQFEGVTQAGESYPNTEPLFDLIRHQAAHYGSLIRTRYGEPFVTAETMRVDDLMALEVSTF
jgi:bacillithiol biosynthesis deacetylase BshB1